MKYINHLTLLLLLFFNIVLNAENGKITSVELFNDSALVTKSLNIELPSGRSQIIIDKLPNNLNSDFIQIKSSQPNAFRIINANYVQRESEAIEKAVEELRDQIDSKHQLIHSLNTKINILKQEENFAQTLADSFSKRFGELEEGQSLSIEQAKSTWSYTQEISQRVAAELITINEKINLFEDDIEDLKREVQQILEIENLLAKSLILEVEAANESTTDLHVTYQVYGTRWFPKYEVRAYPAQNNLELKVQAEIKQYTGEDWTKVPLQLHAHNSSRSGNTPVLHPLKVHKQNDYKETRFRQAELMAFSDSAQSNSTQKNASVTTTTLSFSFTLVNEVSVKSKRGSTTVDVKSISLSTKFWSEVVPRLSTDAFLRTKGKNSSDIPLLPGQALAFVDDVLTAKVSIPKTLPSEDFSLSLGKDMKIIVNRREGVQKDKNSGFIDKTKTLHRQYITTVTNQHPTKHSVVLVDQFPISKEAKIEIERIAPRNNEITTLEKNKESGIFQWEFDLPSKETKQLETEYKITFPRDWDINPNL